MLIGLLAVLGGLLAVVVIIALIAIGIYNNLVSLKKRFENAFAQIDVQLKRRYDLIPNLVEVAKGYMAHEKDTLEAVIKARNAAYSAGQTAAAQPGNPGAIQGLQAAEGQLAGALTRLFAVAEAYPDLKANTNMLSLQEELTTTENRISFARQAYNDSVTQYNTAREVFPAVLFSSALGFAPAQLLEIEEPAQREAPKVKF